MAGLLSRMFGRGRMEQRRSGFTGSLSYGTGFYGGAVSAREAEALGAVAACVELICGSVASLPPELVQDTPEGSIPAPQTAPAWRIIKRPNRQQSWPAFMSWLSGQYLLFGNAAAWIRTDARGAVAALVPLPWPWLSVQVVSSGEGPRLVYDVVQGSPDAALLGLPPNTRLLDDQVLHIRNRSDYGAIGRSVLSRASDPLREGLEIQTMATANLRNGLRPSAVLTAPTYLSDTQQKRFDADWMARFTGALNSGRVPLLEGGWKMETAAMTSVDAQFAEMRQLSVAEIARMFGVPEQLIQPAHRSIADLTPYVTTFAQLALTPIVTAIEAEFDYAVLPSGMHLDLDLASSMMRGSFSAATAAMAALVQSGIISPNDAREELGWSPHPDGAALRVGSPPSFPPDFTGSTAMHPSPGPADGQPQMPSHGNSGSKGNGSMVLQ